MNEFELEAHINCKLISIVSLVDTFIGSIELDTVEILGRSPYPEKPGTNLACALEEIKTHCHTALQLIRVLEKHEGLYGYEARLKEYLHVGEVEDE